MATERQPLQFFEYAEHGIRVLLPSFLKVVSEAPRLSARNSRRRSSIVMLLDPSPGEQQGWEHLLRQPWRGNSMLNSVVIRDSGVEVPYPGFERIVEHRLKGQQDPNTNFAWGLALYPHGHFLQVEIGSFSTFAEEEDIWKKTVESIFVVDQ